MAKTYSWDHIIVSCVLEAAEDAHSGGGVEINAELLRVHGGDQRGQDQNGNAMFSHLREQRNYLCA